MNLAEYGTVGNLIGLVGKRSVYLEGVFARLMYRSLYKMHQRGLHGTLRTRSNGCKSDFAAHRAAREAALKLSRRTGNWGNPDERSNRSDGTIGQDRKDRHGARSRSADTHR